MPNLSHLIGAALPAVAAVAAAQYLTLYVARRWQRDIELPDPCFYAEERSRTRGTPFRIALHGSGRVRLALRRVGARLESPAWTAEVSATRQSASYGPWTGMDWPTTLEIPTTDLLPGMYLASAVALEDGTDVGSAWWTPLILRPSEPAPLRVVCSTNTWEAYNAFGGLGNYSDRATPWPLRGLVRALQTGNVRWVVGERHFVPIVPLPERRPNSALAADLEQLLGTAPVASHLAAGECNLLALLERSSIPYELCSDRDFAVEGAAGARAVIFNTHSEYWSPEMEGRLAALLATGHRVIFFSGNNLYRRVRFAAGAIHVTDQRSDDRRTAALIGAAYDGYGYRSQAPYRIEKPAHWAFDGIDPAAPLGAWQAPDGSAWGASGWETDKIRPESATFEVLAVGQNAEGPAYMTYRETDGGGWIFNAGSVTFTRLLGLDPGLDRLTLNVVRAAIA